MKHKKLFEAAHHNKLIEMLPEDTEAILLNKLITSYIYECFRGNEENKKQLRQYINTIDNNYKKYTLDEFITEIQYKETTLETFFGSFLSDDSDSEEEGAFSFEKLADCNEAHEFSEKANRSNMFYEKKSTSKKDKKVRGNPGDLKIATADPSSLFNKDTRHLVQRDPRSIIQVKKDLALLNTLHKQHQKKEISSEEFSTQIQALETKFFVAQYRGVTYMTTRWSKPQRKFHRKINENGLPIFSHAAYKRAELPLDALHDLPNRATNIEKLMKAAEEIKEVLLEIRKTAAFNYKQRSYDSLADLLQNIYTTNYDEFHKLLRTEKLKILFPEGVNPFVSTGDRPYHALKYAYGIKPYEGHERERLRPRWQKNGRAERPYSGKVYVSLHPITDYGADGPTHVPTLNQSGKVVVDNLIIAECESTFPGFIVANRTIKTHVAKYPSFKGPYKRIYAYKYGMDPMTYDKFQHFFQENPPHTTANKQGKRILGEWLSAFYEVKLIENARQEAEKKDGVLIYQKMDGTFTLDLASYSPFLPHTPQKEREKAQQARDSRASDINSPNITPQKPEDLQLLIQNFSKMFSSQTGKSDSEEETDSISSDDDEEDEIDDMMETLPDGNCAFNGVSLFLYEKLLTQTPNSDPWLLNVMKKLRFTLGMNSNNELMNHLSLSKKNASQVQQLLSPILRKMAIDYMNTYRPYYLFIYLERLEMILDCYIDGQTNNIPDDESFLVHDFIKNKLKQLCEEYQTTGIIDDIKFQLKTWWESEQGFLHYLRTIEKPAAFGGDVVRWGGSVELDILGKILNFRLQIQNNHQGFEHIGKLPCSPFNISINTQCLLRNLSYQSTTSNAEGQYRLFLPNLSVLQAYRIFPEFLENIRQLFILQMQDYPTLLTYEALIENLDLSDEASKAWKKLLIDRGIIKDGIHLFGNGDGTLDIDRITYCLQHTMTDAEWNALHLTLQYHATLPVCSLKYNGIHWSYDKPDQVLEETKLSY